MIENEYPKEKRSLALNCVGKGRQHLLALRDFKNGQKIPGNNLAHPQNWTQIGL